jgi:hypothetical protein
LGTPVLEYGVDVCGNDNKSRFAFPFHPSRILLGLSNLPSKSRLHFKYSFAQGSQTQTQVHIPEKKCYAISHGRSLIKKVTKYVFF